MVLQLAKWVFLFSGLLLVAVGQNNGNFVRPPLDGDGVAEDDNRQGRNLLDWIGLGTGPDTDPYLARTNAECLNGDLAECFKSRALSSFDDFFNKPAYQLTPNARILRMPESQLRQLAHEPYEFSQTPRSDESEWDQLVKFGLRKVEKFLKSTAIEVDFDDEVTETGRYSPRFINEIADEIDIIEDKKASKNKRNKLKKLFIPMLIILKLFKLKLLLFLPLILGLGSFSKLLSFLAIIIPGMIGFFKLCKPNLHSTFGHSNFPHGPQYSPAGISYHHPPALDHFREHGNSLSNAGPFSSGSQYQETYYEEGPRPSGNVHFGGENQGQHLAYSGWGQYRNKESEIVAETSSKKSILPDS